MGVGWVCWLRAVLGFLVRGGLEMVYCRSRVVRA